MYNEQFFVSLHLVLRYFNFFVINKLQLIITLCERNNMQIEICTNVQYLLFLFFSIWQEIVLTLIQKNPHHLEARTLVLILKLHNKNKKVLI